MLRLTRRQPGAGRGRGVLKALDLFCGAGGAARGLQMAGFHVTGVDIAPQPRYAGDVFIQADALTFPLDGFDFVGASPPCQFASVCTPMAYRANHPNLIPATRARLQVAGVPYVIENVANARKHLHNPVMLCGSMFGLGVWRHRYFECSWPVDFLTLTCRHDNVPVLVSGSPRRKNVLGILDRTEPSTQERRDAMGIDWMTREELDEAIPPAYSHYLGLQVIAAMHTVAGAEA